MRVRQGSCHHPNRLVEFGPFGLRRQMSARAIRPKALKLCRADGSVQLGMATGTEAILLKDLRWVIQEKGASNMPFQRTLFVKLEGLKGEVTVDFELTARFIDNQRTKALIWVRTNPLGIK
jgi:hypothetical protein